jgi:hypothetical protein
VKALATAVALSIAWAAPVQAMDYSYRLDKGHLVIDATGVIEVNDSNRFLAFLNALPPDIFGLLNKGGNMVVFNSRGGAAIDGVMLGDLIENYHFATSVAAGGVCSSACVLAWATGTRKSVASDAYIGVHNASATGIGGHSVSDKLKGFDVTGEMAKLIRRYGAPDNVVAKLLDTPSDDMYWLTPDDLAAWNVNVPSLSPKPASPPAFVAPMTLPSLDVFYPQ